MKLTDRIAGWWREGEVPFSLTDLCQMRGEIFYLQIEEASTEEDIAERNKYSEVPVAKLMCVKEMDRQPGLVHGYAMCDVKSAILPNDVKLQLYVGKNEGWDSYLFEFESTEFTGENPVLIGTIYRYDLDTTRTIKLGVKTRLEITNIAEKTEYCDIAVLDR